MTVHNFTPMTVHNFTTMTVHNSRISLEERVVTFVDTKHSKYTLLPSSGLHLQCLSEQRHAYRLHTSHTTHLQPEHRSSMFRCDVCLHLQSYMVESLKEKVSKYRDA
jgi:hypothetical protein